MGSQARKASIGSSDRIPRSEYLPVAASGPQATPKSPELSSTKTRCVACLVMNQTARARFNVQHFGNGLIYFDRVCDRRNQTRIKVLSRPLNRRRVGAATRHPLARRSRSRRCDQQRDLG
jgi:hypothetical protein